MRKIGVALAVSALVLTLAPGAADATHGDKSSRRAAPALRVTTIANGVDLPWDVRPITRGRLLFTQRDKASLTLIKADGTRRRVGFPSGRVWVSGETGLMGLAIDPGFAHNRRIYTCQGWKRPGKNDVRVIAWRLDAGLRRVTRPEVLVKGFPTTSGRHGGCRLLIDDVGSLHVGTGDAAVGTNPQNRRSLGGKTLRLDPQTGRPWPTNPWVHAQNRKKRYVFTYGHRNVQGLAQRNDGSLWSVEHGTFRDDEINLLGRGRNYGWNPVPGYDESTPMTDFSLPGRQWGARWRSGNPTIATSGADFVSGPGWGRYAGTLAVGCLAGERLMFVKFDGAGRLQWTRAPQALKRFGRLRGVTSWRGSLLVTTSNGGGHDRILQVRPAR